MGTEDFVKISIGYTKSAFFLSGKGISTYNDIDPNAYGGVKFRLSIQDIKEGISEPNNNLFNLDGMYEPVEGELPIWVEGPSASGIYTLVRQFEEIADNAARFWTGDFTLPVYIVNQSNPNIGCVLLSASLELPSDFFYQVSVLKKCKLVFKYVRKGLNINESDGNISDNLTPNNRSNRLPVPFVQQSRVKDLGLLAEGAVVYNSLGRYTPTGIFIYNSDEYNLKVDSAYRIFVNPSFTSDKPAQFSAFNEDARNPFSVNASGGVFGFTPTNTTKIVSSGFVYLNMNTSPDVVQTSKGYFRDMDFYGTVKTTFSGTKFFVSIIASDNYNIIAESDQVEIQNIPVPSPVYLGTMKIPALARDVQYRLALQANMASGVLLIDQFVFNGGDGIGKRAIKFDGADLSTNSSASKTFIAFNANYFPQLGSFDSDSYLNTFPTLKFWREATNFGASRSSIYPSYQGNIELVYKRTTSKVFFGTNDTPGVALLMCGATWASGTRDYWMATTTSGSKCLYNAQLAYDYATLVPDWAMRDV